MSPEPEEHTQAPRWLPDAAPSFLSRLMRCVALTPRLWRPWRMWRLVSASTPVSHSALALFLVVVVLTRLLMGVAGAGDDLAFRISPPESPGFVVENAELAREIARPRYASRLRDDGYLDPAWLAAPIAGHTAYLLLLLGLGKDRRRVGVSAPHVLRAWTYGLAWLGAFFMFCALAGAIDSYTSARLVYSGFDHPSDTLDSISRGLIRATESPIVLGLIGLWILLWWRSAIVTAWNIPRGQAGWLLISAVALVIGAGAIFLTRHLQTLRVIAEG